MLRNIEIIMIQILVCQQDPWAFTSQIWDWGTCPWGDSFDEVNQGKEVQNGTDAEE